MVFATLVHRGDHDEVVDDDGDADMLMMSVVICSRFIWRSRYLIGTSSARCLIGSSPVCHRIISVWVSIFRRYRYLTGASSYVFVPHRYWWRHQ